MENSKKFKIQLILIIIAAGILVYLILINKWKKMRDDILGTFSSGSIMNYEYLVIDSENHFWLYNASNQIKGSV